MKRWVFGGVVLLVGVLGFGCSEKGLADEAANSPLAVETSQMFLTVRNTVGVPLTDVTIAIVARGAQQEFSKYFARFESSEKRDISLGDFNGRDGTRFNLRVVKPRSVRIKATDLAGKSYDVELPWE